MKIPVRIYLWQEKYSYCKTEKADKHCVAIGNTNVAPRDIEKVTINLVQFYKLNYPFNIVVQITSLNYKTLVSQNKQRGKMTLTQLNLPP